MRLGAKVAGVAGAVVVLAGLAPVRAPAEPTLPPPESDEMVLGPEGNHLWAYDAASGDRQLVVRAVNGEDPGVAPPSGSDRRDINGQVCVSPDGRHVVTGEDTVVAGDGGDGGSSHDPRIAGWGYFRLRGGGGGRHGARDPQREERGQ